jgi:hypothetical protein
MIIAQQNVFEYYERKNGSVPKGKSSDEFDHILFV